MKRVRLLIVEDEEDVLVRLGKLYRASFAEHGFDLMDIEEAGTVSEARERARQARTQPYDLVSLDVNLSDREVTGLDVLSSLRRYQSAWMVAVLTGVETDPSLDSTLGEGSAGDLRKTLRRRAHERFPAERLHVIEKPSSQLPREEVDSLFAHRVGQIVLLYQAITRSRFIFRPIEKVSEQRVPISRAEKLSKSGRADRPKRQFIKTVSLQWQIRFNCGDLATLPDRAGLRTLHHLLSLPRGKSLTPEEALVIEPKQERSDAAEASRAPGEDLVADFFDAQGIAWHTLDEAEQEKLMAAALSLRFKRYVELRGFQDDDDLSAEEEDELYRLLAELGPLAPAAETAYRRLAGDAEAGAYSSQPISIPAASQEGLRPEGGNYERGQGRRGYDSKASTNFRKRMERTRDYLRENGFADLAAHLEDYMMSTGADWSYNPPEGVEWTT